MAHWAVISIQTSIDEFHMARKLTKHNENKKNMERSFR